MHPRFAVRVGSRYTKKKEAAQKKQKKNTKKSKTGFWFSQGPRKSDVEVWNPKRIQNLTPTRWGNTWLTVRHPFKRTPPQLWKARWRGGGPFLRRTLVEATNTRRRCLGPAGVVLFSAASSPLIHRDDPSLFAF